jgi:ABC-type lipoprotein release transport system permease subunit
MKEINTQRNILDFTLSSLLRRKGKNASLVIIYTLIVFLLASVMFFTHSMRREASIVLKDAPEMVVQKLVAGRQDLVPLAYLEKIRGIRGVSSATGRLWGYYFDPFFKTNYTLMVPGESQPATGTVTIGSAIAKSRQVFEGDFIALNTYRGETMLFQIQKVFSSESALVAADLLLMAEGDFRALFGMPRTHVTDIVLTVRNQRELGTIAYKITQEMPDARPVTRDEILRTYDSVFNWRGGVLIIILFVAVISFVIFAWDKASGLAAEEKREIGILKAIGWETSHVLLMKFWEGIAISFTSFLLGISLAYAHVYFASAILFGPVLKGWSALYPDFRLVPHIDAFQLSTLFFLTVLPYAVATIIPSWRASIIDPDLVMRS